MQSILIATNNQGKAMEFAQMFEPMGFQVKTLKDYPKLPEVEETGKTFEENALLKAQTISNLTQSIVLADDSGLMIDALNGEPGVYSARYGGEDHNDAANRKRVLENLKNVPEEQRTAKFHTTLALVSPEREPLIVNGEVSGYILDAPRGTHGFGYDPLFYVADLEKTFAELSPQEKNEISHRAKALEKLSKEWDAWFAQPNSQ